MKRRNAVPLVSAALVVGTAVSAVALTTPNAGAGVHRQGCHDQITHAYVRPGDEIRNYGRNWICRSDGKLIAAGLPAGYHWRPVWHQVDDCGPRNAGQLKVIFWRGTGDAQSVISCANGTWWPS